MRKVFIDPGIPDFFWDADTNTLYVPPGVPVGSGGGSPDYEVKSADFTAADGGAYAVDTSNVDCMLPSSGTLSDSFDLIVGYGLTGCKVRIPTTPVTTSTLDPAKKSASMTLSGGNLTASMAIGGWGIALGTQGVSTGKWKHELAVNKGSNCFIGVIVNNGSYNCYLGQNGNADAENSVGYWGSGQVYYNLGTDGNYPVAGFTSSDVIDCLLDLDSSPQTVTMRKNGATIQTVNLPSGQTWYPAIADNNADAITVNLGGSTFTYSDPGYSGYSDFTYDTKLNGGTLEKTITAPKHVHFTYVDTTTGWLSDPIL